MLRRTFLKRVGQAVAGFLVLPLFSKKDKADEYLTVKKVKEIRDELVTANGMDQVQAWPFQYKVYFRFGESGFHIINVSE